MPSLPATVASSGDVSLAVHDLGPDGADGPAVLVSHATGFHGRCYLPFAAALARRCIAFDYRGHGATARPAGEVDWQRYGDDAVAMAEWLADRNGSPIDAFGHSMGGACLLIAAHRRPELFAHIVAVEPIVFPPSGLRPDQDGPSPMVQGALRRRRRFDSIDDAIANYAAKPPLGAFTAEALDAYVRYGFHADPEGGVTLACSPETEAATFATGGTHDTWDHLPDIDVDVTVVSGRPLPMQPGSIAAAVAERLPRGRYLEFDHLDHFAPMVAPAEIADVARLAFAR